MAGDCAFIMRHPARDLGTFLARVQVLGGSVLDLIADRIAAYLS